MLPSESKLLDRYQVGRASLREALRLLEVQGLIVIRPGPGGGPMVAEVDSRHFGRMASLYFHMSGATYQDVMDARAILEPLIAGMIAERREPEHIQMLNEYLRLSKATMPWSPPAVRPKMPLPDASEAEQFASSAGFHTMIMSMSGNPIIDLFARSLQDLIIDQGVVAGTIIGPEDQENTEEIHHMIAREIIDGRSAEAQRLMREHMGDYLRIARLQRPALLKETVYWH